MCRYSINVYLLWTGWKPVAVLLPTTVVMLLIACLPVYSQHPEKLEGADVDELVSKSLNNDAGITAVSCRFNVVIGQASNEAELLSGNFSEVLGKANGRWLLSDDHELYQLKVGDVFEMKPVEGSNGTSARIPFPGPQIIIKNDNYVLRLAEMMTSGEIGKRDVFFPQEFFNPRQALGAVGTDRWAFPLNWFIEPPATMTHEVFTDADTTIIKSKMANGELETRFNRKANFLVTFFSCRQGTTAGIYFVSESVSLPCGSFVPKVAHAIFADDGEFPKRTARWELTEIDENPNEVDFTVQLPDVRYQVRLGKTFSNITHIEPNSVVRPQDLGAVFDAAVNSVESAPLPTVHDVK